jgi:hypothetical protein
VRAEGPKEIRRYIDQAIEQTPQQPVSFLAQGPLKLLMDGGPVNSLFARAGVINPSSRQSGGTGQGVPKMRGMIPDIILSPTNSRTGASFTYSEVNEEIVKNSVESQEPTGSP